MFERLTTWLRERFSANSRSPQGALRHTGAHQAPRPAPKSPLPEPDRDSGVVDVDPHLSGRIEDNGPGKNVLIRNKFVREETGTHETLKILDDSMIETGEETGIDPYNTGGFDRSKNWDKRFRN